ncbi:hypothetical protein E2320_000730 [Naja naja]|nr:hypothetical protein E2320_000730 [Naja naja]
MDGVRSNLGWRSSWWMVLWAGTVLHCSFHMAQPPPEVIAIEVDPLNPVETGEVLMRPPIPPDNIKFCTWYSRKNGGNFEEIKGDERITIYSNCTLHIKELTKNDSAEYLLVEGGAGFSNYGNVTIQVLEIVLKPNVIVKPSPFLVEFQDVWLYCDTTVTQDVSWFKDGNFFAKGRKLYIASVTRNNTGEYWCRVSNGITALDSDHVYLSVIYGPEKPVIRPNDVCNEEHINIILFCKADAYPEPQYAWFRDNVELDYGPKLIIEDFSENQAGGYVCQATNELLHKKKTSNIQQIHLKKSCVSEVTITDPKEGTEGQSISLHCTAEGDDVVYSWTKDDQPVIEDERVYLTENDQTLNFNPCDRRDAANYKCHASNSFSSADSDPFGLIIIYGPDPPVINETINLTEETISLTCLAVSNPASEIEWYFNGQLIPISPEVLTRKIIPENSGDYACQATNPTSKMTSKTTMEIDMIGFYSLISEAS